LVRAGAVKARTACVNEMKALVITAPAELREQLPARSTPRLVHASARLPTGGDQADPVHGITTALRRLATRYLHLSAEINDADAQLADLVKRARPDLLAIRGVGAESAAQLLSTCGDNPDRLTSEAAFASLCGVSPVPASSGRTKRHRLSRGADRQANRALYMIVITRMGHDLRTRSYVARRTAEGLSTKEIIKCLKRTVARELYKALTRPPTDNQDLAAAA
jgi:transposase